MTILGIKILDSSLLRKDKFTKISANEQMIYNKGYLIKRP